MTVEHAPVGLRELRHNTSEVLARVRRGETVDVTEYGRLVARIVPVEERERAPVLDRLAAAGRLRPAVRPGYRPRMLPATDSNQLGEALAALRDEERW
ncbi:MAG TPA: type II toxin-antitoxin system prevent-host-death family antitoxin [Mycobacteriales bacterium]|nr:type II toxin-antitoxin system prevent-host-death family antitoxin [Mycobacteriales bacterium]